MKPSFIFSVLLGIFTGAIHSSCADDSQPIKLESPVSLQDSTNIRKLLVDVVLTHEGLTAGSNHSDSVHLLEVYLPTRFEIQKLPCVVVAPGEILRCDYSYLLDRWNGTVVVDFQIKMDHLVSIQSRQFDGSY